MTEHTMSQYLNKDDLIAALRADLAQARTLILAAPLFMPTWPETEGRNAWVRDANKWLDR